MNINQMKVIYKFFLVVFCLVNAACSPVAPWQRGKLAKPEMALDPNPMQTMIRTHSHSSREAGSAGSTTSGGGCGCY